MGQVLHSNTITTNAMRKEIQTESSQISTKALSEAFRYKLPNGLEMVSVGFS